MGVAAAPAPAITEAAAQASDNIRKLGFKIPADCYMDCDIAEPFRVIGRQNTDGNGSIWHAFKSFFTEKDSEMSTFEERCAAQVHLIDQWSSGMQVGEVEEDQADRRIWQYVARRSGTEETLDLATRHVEANPDCTHDRGPLGSLPVHMCFLINEPFHRAFGMFMIDFDDRQRATKEGKMRRKHLPRLIDVPYFSENAEDDVFHGQNLLHCALVHRDSKLVEWLLERSPRLILGFCSGSFYGPTSPCYFGSTPLHFAAVTGQKEMVTRILKVAASHTSLHDTAPPSKKSDPNPTARRRAMSVSDPTNLCRMPVAFRGPVQQQRFLDQPDHWGNNVLHLLVACSGRSVIGLNANEEELDEVEPEDPTEDEEDPWLVNMYDYILDTEEVVRRECFTTTGQLHSHRLGDTPNADYLTPLVMAAQVGNRVMFRYILNKGSIMNWMYGPMVCKSYCLEAFDAPPTLYPDAPSALQVLVENPTVRHMRFFKDPVVTRVVNRNWLAYARAPFYSRLGLSCLTGVFLILSCVTEAYLDRGSGASIASYPLEYFLAFVGRAGLAAAATFLASKEIRVIQNEGLSAYCSETGAAFLENSMSWAFVTAVAASLILPFGGAATEAWCHASLAAVSVVYCGYLFYFFLGFELTGGYIVMIGEMVKTDMARFSATFLTLVFGFATAFFILFRNSSLEAFAIMLRDTFLMAVGQFDQQQFVDCHAPVLCTLLMCVYIIVVNVLLLNLLIATMGETYGRMYSVARQTWMMERCRITLSMKGELGDKNPDIEFFVLQRMQIGLSKTGSGAVADLLELMDEVRGDITASTPKGAPVANTDTFVVADHDGTGNDETCGVLKRVEEKLASQTTFQRFMVAVEPVPSFNDSAPGIAAGPPADVMGKEGGEGEDGVPPDNGAADVPEGAEGHGVAMGGMGADAPHVGEPGGMPTSGEGRVDSAPQASPARREGSTLRGEGSAPTPALAPCLSSTRESLTAALEGSVTSPKSRRGKSPSSAWRMGQSPPAASISNPAFSPSGGDPLPDGLAPDASAL